MRKVGILLTLLLALSGCGGFPKEMTETQTDPCVEVREKALKISNDFPELSTGDKNTAKLELLTWAFLVSDNSECFSDEVVATAKSAIALVG